MRNGGGMRNDMGMRGSQGGMGMKRRWDSSGGGGQGSSDQGYPKRPYQPPSSHFSNHASNGISAGGSYQPKPFRPNSYDQKPPTMSAMPPQTSYPAPSYPKFPGYAQMQMPPSLGAYTTPIQAAIANYTFPPPSSIMPPLPKN